MHSKKLLKKTMKKYSWMMKSLRNTTLKRAFSHTQSTYQRRLHTIMQQSYIWYDALFKKSIPQMQNGHFSMPFPTKESIPQAPNSHFSMPFLTKKSIPQGLNGRFGMPSSAVMRIPKATNRQFGMIPPDGNRIPNPACSILV